MSKDSSSIPAGMDKKNTTWECAISTVLVTARSSINPALTYEVTYQHKYVEVTFKSRLEHHEQGCVKRGGNTD